MGPCTEARKGIDVSERMGDPALLAEQAAAEFDYPTWAGRHPWLAFFVGAPALLMLGVAASTLLVVGLASFVDGQTVETTPALQAIGIWTGWFIAVLPAVGASLLQCYMVHASGRRPAWGFVACSLVALFAGCLMVSCIPPQITPGTGQLSVGFGIGATWNLSHAIAPLLIGAIFFALGSVRGREDQSGLNAAS